MGKHIPNWLEFDDGDGWLVVRATPDAGWEASVLGPDCGPVLERVPCSEERVRAVLEGMAQAFYRADGSWISLGREDEEIVVGYWRVGHGVAASRRASVAGYRRLLSEVVRD